MDELITNLYDPEASKLIGSKGETYYYKLDSRTLTEAYLEYGIMESMARDPNNAPGNGGPHVDIFQQCPVCATTHRTFLDDRETPIPAHYPLIVSTDANMKACRYSSAGRSSEGIFPSTSQYLGAVNDQVADDHDSGVLSSQAKEAEASEAEVDVATGRLLPPCTSSITASRPTSYARGSTDQAGLIGVACAHSYPTLGLFVALWTSENFGYYVYVLKELLKRRPDLVIVYLDVACRFKKRWDKLVAELVSNGVVSAEAEKIGLLLPWMHAFDHNLECQVQFSGLLKDYGRRHGEVIEQFWSLLKKLTKLTRYMTSAHWHDAYNLAIELAVRVKQDAFVELMKGRLKKIVPRIASYKAELEKLRKQAAEIDVQDLDAALVAVEQLEQVPIEASVSTGAQYVQALILMHTHAMMSTHKAGLAVVLPGSIGVKVHARGANETYYTKLVGKAERLAGELGLPLGVEWKRGGAEFEEALKELQDVTTLHYNDQLEALVFKRTLLFKNKLTESGKNAIKLIKALDNRKCIKDLLSVRQSWLSDVQSDAPGLDVVCRGEFPWRDGGVGVAGEGTLAESPAIYHYGRRYRICKAQLDRSLEEKGLLGIESVRTINWIQERRADVKESIKNTKEALVAAQESGDYEAVGKHTGRVALYEKEDVRLKKMDKDAQSLLEYVPAPGAQADSQPEAELAPVPAAAVGETQPAAQ